MRDFNKLISLFVMTSILTGCASVYKYTPKISSDMQTLKHTQGVGTLTTKEPEFEVFMYSTFRTQGFTDPTFTIGYANTTDSPINFATDNIKAYFRGVQVPIYTYEERVAQIESEKRSKQIALAILGGLAAGAAAYGASRRTYTSSYSGRVYGGGRSANYFGTSTMTAYDPVSGILAGAAVGGATGLGIRQLENSANAQQEAAASILQQNTVDPQTMVTGLLILKECCDQFVKEGDSIRFEVSVSGKIHNFEFSRNQVASK